MSKEKIDEMAKDLCDSTMCDLETFNDCRMPQGNCSRCQRVAKDLYNAGYRKQSENVTDINVGDKVEWISVEERLPEPNVNCLVAAKVGNRMVVDLGSREWCFDYRTMEHSHVWSIMNDWDEGEGCEITHWMPLPEAPKMRKEDEGKCQK